MHFRTVNQRLKLVPSSGCEGGRSAATTRARKASCRSTRDRGRGRGSWSGPRSASPPWTRQRESQPLHLREDPFSRGIKNITVLFLRIKVLSSYPIIPGTAQRRVRKHSPTLFIFDGIVQLSLTQRAIVKKYQICSIFVQFFVR